MTLYPIVSTEGLLMVPFRLEMCAEINGVPFSCNSVEEFWELVEGIGDDDLSE
jgi:hypothetical protein